MRTRKDHSAARGRPSRRAAKNRSKYLPLLAAAGLAFAGLLAYLALGGTLSGQGRAAGAPEEAAPDSRPLFSDRQRRKEVSLRLLDQTRHTKGSPDAPVTIIEFSDFQWAYCRQFATGELRQIEEAYIETGKASFGYQHIIILGPESQSAAEASECAAEQGAFWDYHDLLFEAQGSKNTGRFTKDNLKKFAGELGLKAAAFGECLDSGRYRQTILDESQAASSMGVRSTPSFLINGRPLVGAQPFEVFQEMIEAELQGQ